MWNDGWGWWWLVMPAMAIAFWAAVVWLVASLLRSRPGPNPTDGQGPAAPEEILARRLALGEIDDDEYRRRLDTLRGAGHPEVRP
jgi:putative membrane protein